MGGWIRSWGRRRLLVLAGVFEERVSLGGHDGSVELVHVLGSPQIEEVEVAAEDMLWPGSADEPQVLQISQSMPSDPTANSHLVFSLATHFCIPSSNAQQRQVDAQVSAP